MTKKNEIECTLKTLNYALNDYVSNNTIEWTVNLYVLCDEMHTLINSILYSYNIEDLKHIRDGLAEILTAIDAEQIHEKISNNIQYHTLRSLLIELNSLISYEEIKERNKITVKDIINHYSELDVDLTVIRTKDNIRSWDRKYINKNYSSKKCLSYYIKDNTVYIIVRN